MGPPDIRNFIEYVPRNEWGAKAPVSETELVHPIPYVLFTITETDRCHTREECIKAVQKLQHEHMEQGMPDIRFNFLIGDDLAVYEGRGWHAQPSVTEIRYQKRKHTTLEIAYMGGFYEDFPTQPVLDVMNGFVMFGFEKKYIDKTKFLQPR